jgi:AcrR family transcriptional regulator
MARRRTSVSVGPLMDTMLGSFGDSSNTNFDDPALTRLLEAGASLLAEYGLRRWSMDDVADRAGVGRTSVYRKFASRDDLIYAVLAQELRAVFDSVTRTAAHFDTLHDKIVEGALVALEAVDGSLVAALLKSDPTTFLPFLTTEAGPLIALGRELIVSQALALGAEVDRQAAAELAELAARLGISFILTSDTVFPVNDPQAARRALDRVLTPLLAPLENESRGSVVRVR